MKTLVITLTILAASPGFAGDRNLTCESYTTSSGTTHEQCRDGEGHTTRCESYKSSSGTTHTECRN